jgi:hypothetical protein
MSLSSSIYQFITHPNLPQGIYMGDSERKNHNWETPNCARSSESPRFDIEG